MKYAFAAAAIVGAAVATPAWQPEGYGAPAYTPPAESTTCTEEQTWSTSAPSAPAGYTKPSEQTWASSSVWSPVSSSSWVESSSAAPTPYHQSSSWSAESSKTWAESSSSAWKPESSSVWSPVSSSSVWSPESSSTWAETSAKATPTAYHQSSSVKPVGTAPGPKQSGVAGPTGGSKPQGTAAGSSGAWSAPTPTGSPITPYKGAANAVNAAGFLAGVGAVAALFL